MTDQQPHRPPLRGANRYAAFKDFKQDNTAPTDRKDLFTVIINAASEKGNTMDEQQFLIDVIFKPIEPGIRLRPEETQLLLAYMGEILKGIENEETLLVEAKSANEDGGGQ
jgi:hypothetical protein